MTKNCLIIGIKSSLGNEIKRIFKINKYEVFGTSRNFNKNLNPKEIFLDFANLDSLNNLKNQIPNIDCLIFCSGILIGKDINGYKDEEIFKVYQTNIIGPVITLSRISKKLQKKSSIVFIGSIAGSAGSYDEVYASSKSALTGLVKSLAKKSENLMRFNLIAPGLIENSTMFKKFSSAEIENHKLNTPTKELNELRKISQICFNICQDEWSQLNGQTIDINGGRYV